MAASLRDFAARMDPMLPAATLRELDRRHRWVDPHHQISLRAIAARHADPATRQARFLSYNTFLLPGVAVDYDVVELLAVIGVSLEEALIALQLSAVEMLQALGRDALDVLKAIYDSPLTLAEALGLPHSDLVDAAKTALNWITFGVFDLATNLSFEVVFKVFGGAALDALNHLQISVIRILSALGVKLQDALRLVFVDGLRVALKVFGVDVPYPFRIGAKPALEVRALAVGQVLVQQGYDIMALSEVWDQEPSARDKIIAAWNGAAKPLNQPLAIGPGKGDDRKLDSGLLRLCAGEAAIVEQMSHTFAAAGEKLFDTDAWASKGVLLTRIRLGAGMIDLYNTHLISGGDLLGKFLANFVPSLGDRGSDAVLDGKRLAQIDELLQFIAATHKTDNVAIVCGDTNIDAELVNLQPTAAYAALLQRFNAAGFDDLWALQRGFVPAAADRLGPTHGGEDDGPRRFDNGICRVLPAGGPNAGFCDEATVFSPPNAAAHQNDKGGRIDYVLVERPRTEHTFTLDVSRLRRAPFEWPGLPDDQRYLSDHIGSDLTLIASPLRPQG